MRLDKFNFIPWWLFIVRTVSFLILISKLNKYFNCTNYKCNFIQLTYYNILQHSNKQKDRYF